MVGWGATMYPLMDKNDLSLDYVQPKRSRKLLVAYVTDIRFLEPKYYAACMADDRRIICTVNDTSVLKGLLGFGLLS